MSLRSLRDRVMEFGTIRLMRPLLVKLVDALQSEPPALQILVPALTLHCLCKGTGLNAHEVLQVIERMEGDIDAAYANQFDAMAAYAQGELNL